jgi:MFS family permease
MNKSSLHFTETLEATDASASAHIDPPTRFDYAGIYGLLFLTVIYATNYFDRQLLGLLLPLIKDDLDLTDTALGLVSGVMFVLVYSIAGVPIARLADRYNRRDIIAIGLTFWSLFTIAHGFALNMWQLATARLLLGAGEAAGIAPSNAMVADLAPPERRPFALGILVAGSSLGAIFLFPLAGWIANTYGWRMAFVAAGVLGLVLAPIFRFTVREPLRFGAVNAPRRFGPTLSFLLGSRTFIVATLSASMMGISLNATIVWTPAFLQRIHDLSVVEIGASIGPIRGVTAVLGAILGGWITSHLIKHDIRWALWVPAIACIAVVPSELLFLFSEGLVWCLAGYALGGFFTALHFAPLYSTFMLIAEPTMRATVIALFLLVANLVGQIFGPLCVGMLNDRLIAEFGSEAIRIGLLASVISAGLAGIGFIIAARWLCADAARVEV